MDCQFIPENSKIIQRQFHEDGSMDSYPEKEVLATHSEKEAELLKLKLLLETESVNDT